MHLSLSWIVKILDVFWLVSFCRIIYLKNLVLSIGWSIYMLIFMFYDAIPLRLILFHCTTASNNCVLNIM